MRSDGFEDHFSEVAESYARYRPTYPASLFAWLASCCRRHDAAWDCGTGTGQAAVGLAAHFDRVFATDPSDRQIANALTHPKVAYSVAPAEASGLPDASVDLVTVAVALHWFDLDLFYPEVRRVARPGAVLAAWCYTRASITPVIDGVIEGFYAGVVGPYWPMERRVVEGGYANLPFPFPEIEAPATAISVDWDLAHLVGYLRTWSATQRAARAMGTDPIEQVMPGLRAAWGDPARVRAVRWPLGMRVGRVP